MSSLYILRTALTSPKRLMHRLEAGKRLCLVRRQIKNQAAHIGKISNPCYKLAVAGFSPPELGARTIAVEDM